MGNGVADGLGPAPFTLERRSVVGGHLVVL